MNAVKFTPSGGRVEVSSRRDGEVARIVVSDTGEGIAAETLPHVFEMFEQEDSSSTRSQGGLGVGLSLVRRLVELHGGTVVAESRGKGRGASFTIALPLAGSQSRPGGQGSTEGGRRRTLDGVRVLVVDDDADFLELSALVLRGSGAEVRGAGSAARAYEVVESWLPDVIVTDLAMPDEDGFMLVRALRTLFSQRRAHVAIIAVTAYGTPDSRTRAALAGFDLYLTKPVDPLGLAAAVASVIGGKAGVGAG
jgi:CheY-like chemotaxis protein